MRSIAILLLFLLCGCGASYHLKKAEYHLLKAEAKGAKINRDTVWTNHRFKLEGIKVQFDPKLFTPGKMTFVKDNVTTVIETRFKPGTHEIDTVYVQTDCPDKEVVERVPTAVNQEISAGYSLWDVIILAIVCIAVGAVASRIFWRS